VAVARSGAQWANIEGLTPSATSVVVGGALSVGFEYEDDGAASMVQWYLDKDDNPYNGNGVAIGGATLADTGPAVAAGSASLLVNGTAGTYYLEAEIANAASVRYAYTQGKVTVTVPPPVPERV
jgi:hypothetical protein